MNNSLINISTQTLNALAQNKSVLLRDRIIFEEELNSRGEQLKAIAQKQENIRFNSSIFSGRAIFLLLVPILYYNYISAKTLVNQGQKAQNQFYAISIAVGIILYTSFTLLKQLFN
ncbi:MAG: hypothetical protein N4A35_03550 [Flavobacteriales bacterium]|jgi:hypothetical protein|nr:hypothetical protein [Flavobacteriales bacterium]